MDPPLPSQSSLPRHAGGEKFVVPPSALSMPLSKHAFLTCRLWMNQIQAGGQQVQLCFDVQVLLLTLGLNLALEFQFQLRMPGRLGGGGRFNKKKPTNPAVSQDWFGALKCRHRSELLGRGEIPLQVCLTKARSEKKLNRPALETCECESCSRSRSGEGLSRLSH